MLLTVNIGNSEISTGLFDREGRLLFVASVLTDKNKSKDQCAIDIKSIFSLYGYEPSVVEGAIISSVVPPLTERICEAVEFLTGRKAMVMGPGIRTGLNIRTQSHSELGEDLVACAVGAVKKYRPPFIIVDLGTAITFSAVGEDYSFLGGAIYPGMSTAINALSRSTAQLPYIALRDTGRSIGRNTIDAMQAGMLYGTAGAIEKIVTAMRGEIGENSLVIATGERMNYIFEKCAVEMIYDPNIMMEGLYQIYMKNA